MAPKVASRDRMGVAKAKGKNTPKPLKKEALEKDRKSQKPDRRPAMKVFPVREIYLDERRPNPKACVSILILCGRRAR